MATSTPLARCARFRPAGRLPCFLGRVRPMVFALLPPLILATLVVPTGPALADASRVGHDAVDQRLSPRGAWPLSPRPHLLRGFNPPDTPWGSGHRGVDLAARVGQEVRAAADGVVGFAGTIASRGVVTVIHLETARVSTSEQPSERDERTERRTVPYGGLHTTYEPVEPAVAAGIRVSTGDVIGHLQAVLGHCLPARPCLHWGLLQGTRYLDPLALLGRGPSRLLPVRDARVPAADPAPAPPGHGDWLDSARQPSDRLATHPVPSHTHAGGYGDNSYGDRDRDAGSLAASSSRSEGSTGSERHRIPMSAAMADQALTASGLSAVGLAGMLYLVRRRFTRLERPVHPGGVPPDHGGVPPDHKNVSPDHEDSEEMVPDHSRVVDLDTERRLRRAEPPPQIA